jgi:hypothetical protein
VTSYHCRFLSRLEGIAVRCGNLPGRRFPVSTTLGKVDHEMIAEPHAGLGMAAAEDFGPELRRNGSDADLGKMDAIGRNRRCN